MQKNVDILAFLEKVMRRNTQHYQSDFQYDAEQITAAAQDQNMEERAFYWMSRPSGTWCVKEREVFIQESESHTIWTNYEGDADHIKAYRVVVSGHCEGVPVGDVFPINYKEQVQRVKKTAVHAVAVALTFESGQSMTLPYEQVSGHFAGIISQYGNIQHIHYLPESEAELSSIISAEHRCQKGQSRKPPGKPAPAQTR